MNFNLLRDKYQEFHYYGMDIQESDSELTVTYSFEIINLEKFNPSYTFAKKDIKMMSSYKIIKELLFNLGMIEMISYWKATCSPKVYIHGYSLDENKKNWWKKLYYHGLGEFLYINNIKIDVDNLMDIISLGDDLDGDELIQSYSGNIIPVGGGKDSFVSLEILKDFKDQNHTLVINKVMSAIHAVEAAGYAQRHIQVTRRLDLKIVELNKKGFLNGHTPFSAMVAFVSVISAVLWQKKYVCLSNESSANESTINGMDVNHQYSKSVEFEKDFNNYINTYIFEDVKYFSLLRGLSELQIASIFATLKNYHQVFKSCNIGSKKEEWCNNCPKCLFVYIMLAAFLNDEELYNIFNSNLLDNENLIDTMKQLCGESTDKPFECVGTREEVQVAIYMAIKKRKETDSHLPLILEKALTWKIFKSDIDVNKYRDEFNDDNLIEKNYIDLLKKKVLQCWK
ncbi:MAG: hypothetical protein ACK5KQ_06900 [Anaerorhabdus sp.]